MFKLFASLCEVEGAFSMFKNLHVHMPACDYHAGLNAKPFYHAHSLTDSEEEVTN